MGQDVSSQDASTQDAILYTCTVHGPLTIAGVIKSGVAPKQKYRCRECYKAIRVRHYAANKEKINAKQAAYRQANPEKVKIIKRESYARNREKYIQKERIHNNRHNAKRTKEMHDSYIVHLLSKRMAFKTEDIPKQLIELKRVTTQIKRLIKIHKKEREYEPSTH